ncbi:MAG: hypothetical protein IKT01_01330 [Eubacteriaceae bacterium]|nr:hypothetical protein [Eubacteriaceae bacterium]
MTENNEDTFMAENANDDIEMSLNNDIPSAPDEDIKEPTGQEYSNRRSTQGKGGKIIVKKGVNFFFALFLVIIINAGWFLGVNYWLIPKYETVIAKQMETISSQENEILDLEADYNEQFANYTKTIEELRARVKKLEEKLADLQQPNETEAQTEDQ